ncbi:MAG: DUF4870 domain-containing protein [Acidimicrobiales bacterium]|nr:DUF4870 domain-containing protein [Acidimicrobiales bacterium]
MSQAPGWYRRGPEAIAFWDGESWIEDELELHGAVSASGGDRTTATVAIVACFFFGLVGAGLFWVGTRTSSDFLRHHASGVVRFHALMTLAIVISSLLVLVVIGLFLLLGLFIYGVVVTVRAASAAHRGEKFVYPSLTGA